MPQYGFGLGSSLRPCDGAEPGKAQEKQKMQPDDRDLGWSQPPTQSDSRFGQRANSCATPRTPEAQPHLKAPHIQETTLWDVKP